MRKCRTTNPYILIVWIVAVGNELKVTNPDNILQYFATNEIQQAVA